MEVSAQPANLMTLIPPSPWRDRFALETGTLYFNHAGVGPMPRRAAERVAALADNVVRRGALDYPQWEALHEETRRRCARLVNAPLEQVAFAPSTSAALSWMAIGLDWRTGDELVTTDQEFPSNAVVWQREAQRQGVTVRQAPSRPDGAVTVEALLERVTPRTRVVTVSWVQYATGAVVDLAKLGAALRQTDTLLVVDAIQGVGALPAEPLAWGVDAFAADGHKWLLGPEGYGLLVLSEKALARVTPRVLGWHSVVNAGDYSRLELELRAGARRFEAGSPNFFGAAALGEGIGVLLEAGAEEVGRRVRHLTGALADGLRALGCRIHTPLAADGGPGAGILVFSHPATPTRKLHLGLQQAGVFHAERGQGIRFSPHFYQDGGDVQRALEIVNRLLG